MAATVQEHYRAHGTVMDGDGNFTRVEATYLVSDADTEEDALEAARLTVPAEWGELPLAELEIAERSGHRAFLVTASWKDETVSKGKSGDEEEEPTVSFDCGGGTMHLTHSYSQRIAYGTKSAGGAIGWNGKTGAEMAIAGVDVPAAQLRETYTRTMRLSQITTAFKRKAAKLVGKVNSAPFKGWEPGEAMFLGLSFSSPAKKSAKVTVTFNFAIQPNESTAVGGHEVSKLGFEYAWALSRTETGEDGAPAAAVDAVYVDQVCRYDSFAALGL